MLRILPRRALVEPKATVQRIDAGEDCSTATLHIDGLVCSACAANVRCQIEQVVGVRDAHVDLDTGEAHVVYDALRTAPEALVAAVERAVLFPKARRLLAGISHRWTQIEHR